MTSVWRATVLCSDGSIYSRIGLATPDAWTEGNARAEFERLFHPFRRRDYTCECIATGLAFEDALGLAAEQDKSSIENYGGFLPKGALA